jgi:hypothetical protein
MKMELAGLDKNPFGKEGKKEWHFRRGSNLLLKRT